jgi:hypothetical protein
MGITGFEDPSLHLLEYRFRVLILFCGWTASDNVAFRPGQTGTE